MDLTGYSRAQIMQKGKTMEQLDRQTKRQTDRQAQHFNTHLNVFVQHFIQLFAKMNEHNNDNNTHRLLMSFPLRAGYKGRAQTAN